MKSSIIDNVKSLPPLSSTIVNINKIYSDENSTIRDMANVIEHDPMIIANILKIANSPLYGFGREIKNPAQAVALFGMNMTRSIAIGNSVRKLLNVDMQPYGVTSDEFAHISSLQATLMLNWYKKIDRHKAEKLYLAAFLQETGKILIASEVIQNDESISFASEVENSNNLAMVEKAYSNATCGEVTALIFKHWGFDSEFIEMIKYSDNPSSAPHEIKEYATALNIVKTIIPINKPLSEMSINFGLKIAGDAGYNVELLESTVNAMLELL
ncbi:MAG: histidine kinase [Sulfurimonas sp. RIFCSPHIGHO2_12_FULL_36_9]|uniref:HDOD domain-containing protein n=1 Tax=Sulfurimonas sp. RIFCSPLOWO2_12_36_12 TaxID=1802253 RepID=UPI0008BF6033|nr:HDOD domain-containing protein [Sulfurimonas sp. RIFCSPLOWO2_12_36_12]OHD98171.1 MAG: histidine kinase [Sulfurimonas sp. RIFCSPHIGHO2_12_FULL_36_9]OHD99959.1 MAG: histidine kinase [Sulfurimonas sp. RIFCSPLOWO2_02_FULL_36_28]OHE00356.1 MAG: histidine kinase [Sulfurimonas sp. RIFCSPLOWO2_12_36_12]